MQWQHPSGFVAADDPARVDLDVVHGFLRTAYWSPGLPREVLVRAVENSLNLGVYTAADADEGQDGPDGAQVAFARAVTDRATFAWIADVFVLPAYRGHGLGRFVVSTLLAHPELQDLRRLLLATADAHSLYRSYGFTELEDPTRFLGVRQDPAVLYGQA